MTTLDAATVADINALAEYLSDAQLLDFSTSQSVDCIILCASAVLHGAETLFGALSQRPSLTKCLVLCGGIGHSTQLMRDAIEKHPVYSRIISNLQSLPEARMLEMILDEFFDRSRITEAGCKILVEDESTNCGQNASFSRRILDQAGCRAIESCMVIQDPTMMRRTKASFEKIYYDASSPVFIISCPVFVPQVQLSHSGSLTYNTPLEPSALWEQSRFLGLIMGEVPRLRDDENGYGPSGRGFISHVDIPIDVEMAWSRLSKKLETLRRL